MRLQGCESDISLTFVSSSTAEVEEIPHILVIVIVADHRYVELLEIYYHVFDRIHVLHHFAILK